MPKPPKKQRHPLVPSLPSWGGMPLKDGLRQRVNPHVRLDRGPKATKRRGKAKPR